MLRLGACDHEEEGQSQHRAHLAVSEERDHELLLDLHEIGLARQPVQKRESEEQNGRGERSDDQVLDAGFDGAAVALGVGHQHEERNGDQFERHVEGDQLGGSHQEHHPGDGKE